MSTVTLVGFIEITDKYGNIQDRYQNGKKENLNALDDGSGSYVKQTENIIQLNGEDHYYLPFLYQGAAKNRSGDNMTSSLILANSELSMNYAQQIVINKYHIKVETWLMTEAFERSKQLSEETWLASNMSYNPENIELILSSAIDAVGANAPDKVLTRNLVGALPVTGSLQNR